MALSVGVSRLSDRELRVVRAFAEAMAPGVAGLPAAAGPDEGAAGAVDVGEPMRRYLSALPARRIVPLRIALRVFDWSSFPWRFSRAPLSARQRFLQRLETSRSGPKQDLLLLLKVLTGSGYANDPRVREASGSTATCVIRDQATPKALTGDDQPLGDLTPQGTGEDCDVCIVGSGAGGAVAATVLAEAGLDVLVLEAGPYMDRRTYPDEPLEALGALYRDGGLTFTEGLPAIATPVGRAVGGTTVINSGTCFRAPDPVLERWRSEHGISWATELAPDFAQAEEMLHVRPVDPETMGRNGQILREGADALGLSHHPLSRNAGSCETCSSCPYGCRLDAKRAMHVSYLPRAVAAGARVRAGVDVRELELSGRRVSGVKCVAGVADPYAPEPREFRVRAKHGVIVAGGAFGTPELLLRSGIRSASGQIGRNLRIHPACWVGARFDEPVNGWDGVMQSYAVDEWKDRGLLLEATFTPLAFGGHWLPGVGAEHQRRMAEYGQVASTGVHISDTSSGRVGLARDGSLRITYGLNRHDAELLTFGIARSAEIFRAAGAIEVYPQIAGISELSREGVRRLESSPPPARRMRVEAFHPLGTARMDADPSRGVIAPDGAVHGYSGLWVADASAFPGSIGVNPMMTILAMSQRIAGAVAQRLM